MIILNNPHMDYLFCDIGVQRPKSTNHNQIDICKQLEYGWNAELLGVSSVYKLFDTQTTFTPTLSDIEEFWRLKQKRNVAVDNLLGGLRV